MTWQCFRLTYELHSPLHIGYHKVGNVQRTRYYIPARNLRGAVTERLTRSGFDPDGRSQGDYGKIGRWVQEHCVFTYWFVCDVNGDPLVPCYTEDGLRYGNLTPAQFERRYLGVYVSTALDPAATAARTGSLHEVEYIAPKWPDEHGLVHTTRVTGWLFLDDKACSHLSDEAKRCSWLGRLQVGGERRYGFGQLRLKDFGQSDPPAGYSVLLNGSRPRLRIQTEKPLLAHTLANNVRAHGQIEVLVGRETTQSHTFGGQLTPGRVCWAPGSVVKDDTELEMEPEGFWRFVR